MPDFSYDPRRDATPAIRGYVYQVDRSIECWLRLKRGVELHLECGEDIDHVARDVVARRTTEQVKYDSDSVTLRSPNAVEAIANFLKHRSDNPNSDIRFRYLTNAPFGKEKVASVKEAGIKIWNRVRDRTSTLASGLSASEQTQALLDIQKLMARASRPSGYNKKSWQVFQTFWAKPGDEELLNLIDGLEWANNAPSAESMQPALCRLLIEAGHASGEQSANELYNRLFVFVIKLLATEGPKVLTNDQLLKTLALPLNEADRQLLERLSLRVAKVEGDIADLREQQNYHASLHQHHDAAVAALTAQLSGLLGGATNTVFAPTLAAPPLDVPQPAAQLSQRNEGVQMLLDALDKCVWLSVEGAVSCGKTHLTILTARHPRFSSSETGQPQVLWLSLRDLSSQDALAQIDAMITAFAGPPPPHNRAVWHEQFCRACAPDALVVLDDLPQLSGFDALAAKVVELCRAAQNTGIKFVSTSHYSLPLEVGERLNDNVKRIPCPAMNDDDAAEILLAYGAPSEQFGTSRAKFINLRLKGHPLLLSAFARYLQKRDWRWGDEELRELLSAEADAEFTSELNAATLRRLISNVEVEAREMLYRLNTCGAAFSRKEVDLLAAVTPSLGRPGEKLAQLTGLWVQAENDARWRVSPLVEVLGETELSHEVRKHCHGALAQNIVGRGRLDQFDTASLLHHLTKAEEWERTGGILAHALQTLWSQNYEKRPSNDAGLTLMWSGMPLPSQISLALRLFVRAYHVGFAAKWNEDLSFGARDLMELIAQATPEEAWVMPVVLSVAVDAMAEFDFPLYCRVVGAALQHATAPLLLPNGELLPIPDDYPLEGFLWVKAQCIRSAADLSAWLGIIETIPLKSRLRAMDDGLAPIACLEVANLLWRRELEKPEAEHDWKALNVVLQQASNRCFEAAMPILGAAFARTLIIIQSEHQDDFGAARITANAALPKCNDENAAFLVEETLGRVLLTGKQADNAALWLEKASQRGGDYFALQRMQSLVCWSKAVAEKSRPNAKLAIEHARRAVGLAHSAPDVPTHEEARAHAELGIACWLGQDLNGALDAFENAVRLLVDHRKDSDYWKDAFVMLGHALGYITAHAIQGQGPQATLDGEEYIAPYRTMFIGFHSRRAALYDPTRDVFLLVQLTFFASEIERDDRSIQWALPALGMARQHNQLLAVWGVASRIISHWIENDRYQEALQLAREQAVLMIGNQSPKVVQELSKSTDPFALAPLEAMQLDETEQATVELFVATSFLLPAAFRIATLAQNAFSSAASIATQIQRLCHEQFEETRHPFWREAAYIFERTYQSRPTYEYLMRYPINGGSEAMDERLRLLCYLGASLQNDISLEAALELHLAMLPELDEGFLRNDRTSYRRIAVPFFFAYWLRAFSQERHQFASHSSPAGATLEQGVAQAISLPPEAGIKQLFIIMFIALNIAGSTRAHEWLGKLADSDLI